MKLSKNAWIGIGIIAVCLLGGGIYLLLTKDSRAMNRMERQIGPLPER